jgi:CBS domain-containing protein
MSIDATELTARDLMSTGLLTFSPDQDILDAIDQLVRRGVSGGPVCDGDRLVGILSEKDCLNLATQGVAYQLPNAGRVRDFMKKEVVTIGPDTDLLDIAILFLRNHFRRLPVVEDGVVIGQISRRDVLRGIQKTRRVASHYPDYRAPA